MPLLTGCSKWLSNEAAGSEGPEAYSFRYVEGAERPRTKLEAIFSILHHLSFSVLRLSNANRMAMIHSRTTTFGSSHPFISKW